MKTGTQKSHFINIMRREPIKCAVEMYEFQPMDYDEYDRSHSGYDGDDDSFIRAIYITPLPDSYVEVLPAQHLRKIAGLICSKNVHEESLAKTTSRSNDGLFQVYGLTTKKAPLCIVQVRTKKDTGSPRGPSKRTKSFSTSHT